MQKKYHGVIVPMVTPFDKSGQIDRAAVIRLIDYFVRNENFPFVLGTTGESASVSSGMARELIEIVSKEVNQRTTLYAGISGTCLTDSLERANRFYELGTDVFVAHLPSYYPLTDFQIYTYFEKLADALPGPLMLYNIPSTTHMSMPLEIISRLSYHQNIIGIKDSERSLERMDLLAKEFSGREDFSLLSGWTSQSAYALQIGFDGVVPNTANLIPDMFQKLFKAMSAGDIQTAQRMQANIDHVANLYQTNRPLTEVFAALKILMSHLGLCQPCVLPPLTALNENEAVELKKSLDELNLENLRSVK